jgi:nucleoside-diphosphate-sugar epimerase
MEKAAGKVLVTGGGGFISGHLVAEFIRRGYTDIRVAACKPFTDWTRYFRRLRMSAPICASCRPAAPPCGRSELGSTAATVLATASQITSLRLAPRLAAIF